MKSGSMRILYLSQYFPPEAGATQTRAYEMARNLVRLGHAVTMIAEVPNHPSGIIPPAYRGKLVERSQLEGIEVIRVWVKASPIKSFRNRMLFYLSYMAGASLAGLLLAHGRYDLIYASSPPLFVGGAALALSALRRIPMLFEVRDLWPESAVALGELSNPRAVAWATRLEEACYRRARVIIVVTEGIRRRLLQRGLVGDKVHLIPNGANVDLFHFDPGARRRVRQELSLGEKFVAIYAGIHGVAQGLETMVEAARRLQADSQIHFLLVGDGPKKAELVELVRQYKLANVTLLDEQPRPAIPALLSAADAAVIPLRKLEIFKGALPSKMFDSWACERPVLLSVDGEARQVMEAARGGVFVEPEDPQALAQAILELRRQPELRQQMGNRGRSFTERHYSRRAQAEQLAGIMQAVLKSENN
jgi:colanic acid biosynthesis glycosyl transferase WcaI